MSLIRSIFAPSASTSDLLHPTAWLQNWALGRKTASGERVTPSSAMGLSAYYASIRNISEDLAKLPGQVRRKRSSGRGSDDERDHSAWRLFHTRFNPIMSAFEGRRLLTARAMGWGNGIAEIVRDAMGQPVELWPIATERVSARMTDDGRGVVYDVRNEDGSAVTLQARDVLHIRGAGTGIWGYSVAQLGADSIGTGLAAQRFSAAYFGEGMAKRLVAIVKENLSERGRAGLRKRIMGGSEEPGARKIPIIPADVTLHDAGVNPSDALNIERERYTVEDVARWFRMSLSKLQVEQRAKGWSTIEGENTAYATDALGAWATQWEQEMCMKLLLPAEESEVYFRHNFAKLMQADYKNRVEGLARQVGMGLLTPNEARELEDRNPIDDPAADLLYIQSGFVPLEDAGADDPEPGPVPPQLGGPPEEEPDDPDEAEDADDDPEDVALERFRQGASSSSPVFVEAARRLLAGRQRAIARAVKRYAGNPAAWDKWAEEFRERELTRGYDAFDAGRLSLVALAGAVGLPDARSESVAALNKWANAHAAAEIDEIPGDAEAVGALVLGTLTDAITGACHV